MSVNFGLTSFISHIKEVLNMNITFMIGNGFDIGLGMATSFKEFFPIYCAKSLDKDDTIKQLAESITADEDAWSYFEKQLGKYTEKFDDDTVGNFCAQLNDFTSEFIKYLRGQEELLSFDDEQLILKTLKDALTSFYKNGNLPTNSAACIEKVFQNASGDEHRYNFISFNYSNALQRCLAVFKDNVVTIRKHGSGTRSDKIGTVVNVHGTKDNFPIMGVNDVSQITNKQLASSTLLINRLVKPQINTRLRMNNAGRALDVLNSSRIICVYGMSLGETDRDWWDYVITWLHADSGRQLVIFNYDDKYSTSLPMNWLDKEDSILKQLASHNKNKSISVEKLSGRIHIAVHKNIFAMPLTDKVRLIYDEAIKQLQKT